VDDVLERIRQKKFLRFYLVYRLSYGALGKKKERFTIILPERQSFGRKLPTQKEAMKINLTESTYRTEMRVQERYSRALVCKNGSRKPGI
jgi:hypothetical protein